MVVKYAEEHNNLKAERNFGVNEKLVRDWRKSKDSLLEMNQTKKVERCLKARWPELEVKVQQWIINQRAEGHGLSKIQVRLKAQALARELGLEGFAGTSSWCQRFLKRHQLSM